MKQGNAIECRCACGAAEAQVMGESLARFYCHCTICQSLYKQPYADVTVWRAESITLSDSSDVLFKRYRSPPAIQRGTCTNCGNPVVAFLQLAPFVRLGFVPARNFAQGTDLVPSSMHIFYHRKTAEVEDALPKVDGYFASQFAVLKLLLRALARGPRTV